jgi:hypothetical protein
VSKLSQRIFLSMLAIVCLFVGCGDATKANPTPGATTFPVVVFSDLHFNPFYDPALLSVTRLFVRLRIPARG